MNSAILDLRYAWRGLRGRLGYSLAALVTLTLGIGANIAIFTVIHGVLLRPLALESPERLVRIYQAYPERGFLEGTVSRPDFDDWSKAASGIASMAAYRAFDDGMVFSGSGEPEELATTYIHGDFFGTLGVSPLLGTTIGTEEQRTSARRVVISHGLWQRRFGGRPDIVGRTIELEHQPFEVVGVMPGTFRYPSPRTEVWASLSLIPASSIPFEIRGMRLLDVVGRLGTGVTLEEADAELDAIAARLAEAHPDSSLGGTATTVRPLGRSIVGPVRSALLLLGGAVVLVLLIACANVANLTLARTSARRRELAIRAALGAGRWRIVRQLLTESLLLAAAGGLAGLGLAVWGVDLLVASGGDLLPRMLEVRPDAKVIAFAASISALTGLVFGLLPAIRASRVGVAGDLGSDGRGAESAAEAGNLRRALVVAEVALAVVLTIGAALLLRSFAVLVQVDTGFDDDRLLAASLTVPASKYESSESFLEVHRRLLERVAEIVGVQRVATIKTIPLLGNGERALFSVEGRPETAMAERPVTSIHHASPGILATMGVPLLRGRGLSERDMATTPLVAVASATLVDRHFGGEDPLGQRLVIGGTAVEIVGVAGDIASGTLGDPPANALLVPIAQSSRRVFTLMVRADGAPERLMEDIRAAVRAIDPEQPITRLTTMSDVVDQSVGRPRFLSLLLGLFGVLALFLSAVGVYGLLTVVTQGRRREIGIRRALGASRSAIAGMILRQSLSTAGAGAALGVIGALALGSLFESHLFGIGPRDPVVFVTVPVVILAISVGAGLAPLRRALRVSTVRALQ